LIAKMASTLAEISAGRFVLGLGAGWNEAEFRAFGIPFDHRVGRFEESFTIVRRLLAGERVTLSGRHVQVEDAVLLPAPAHRPRLMIGSNGPRMLGIALGHVDAWNTWYEDYGNTPEGFAALNERITRAVEESGRAPGDVERSACVLVRLDNSTGARPDTPQARALEGSDERIADGLRGLAQAGADEAILVVDPIDERSIERLGRICGQGLSTQ
jgi:alkanesulfonate monooxygenase SsuD/methylene tetrahydromethanopterin reductase-like flavin-dependent oxidoreductase (luciferase family)